MIVAACAPPCAPHGCGYRYVAFRWDSIAPTTYG
jgi:hypothetical protein